MMGFNFGSWISADGGHYPLEKGTYFAWVGSATVSSGFRSHSRDQDDTCIDYRRGVVAMRNTCESEETVRIYPLSSLARIDFRRTVKEGDE